MSTRKRREFRGSFKAKDATGNIYTVNLFVDVVIEHLRSGIEEMDGQKSLVLSDGRKVNWRAKGNYEIVQGKIELTSDDPNAP